MRDIGAIAAAVIAAVPGVKVEGGILTVAPGAVTDAVTAIKMLGGFMLFDITCVDRPLASAEGVVPAYPACYEVAWRFMDLKESAKEVLTLRTFLDRADPSVASVMGIYKAADVLEREVWDLMGIRFTGREKLERILCRDDFEGHPLRKDFVVPKRSRYPEDERAAAAAPGADRAAAEAGGAPR
jgi:NADH:ubiquinone oxidoreductase subunit C